MLELVLTDTSTDPFPRATVVTVGAHVYVVATRALAETMPGTWFLAVLLRSLGCS